MSIMSPFGWYWIVGIIYKGPITHFAESTDCEQKGNINDLYSNGLYAKEDVYDLWFDGWSYTHRLPL